MKWLISRGGGGGGGNLPGGISVFIPDQYICLINIWFSVSDVDAAKVAARLRENGLLCKPTQKHVLRFAPPLVITEEQMREACDIIKKIINSW